MRYLWIEDMYYNKIQEWDLLRCIFEDEREIYLISINSDKLLNFIKNNNIWDLEVIWNVYKNPIYYEPILIL